VRKNNMVGDNWTTVEAPSFWLVYLEYGDVSNYSNNEIDAIDTWFKNNGYKYISANDSIGLGRFGGVLCDLCEIIVEIRGE